VWFKRLSVQAGSSVLNGNFDVKDAPCSGRPISFGKVNEIIDGKS